MLIPANSKKIQTHKILYSLVKIYRYPEQIVNKMKLGTKFCTGPRNNISKIRKNPAWGIVFTAVLVSSHFVHFLGAYIVQ